MRGNGSEAGAQAGYVVDCHLRRRLRHCLLYSLQYHHLPCYHLLLLLRLRLLRPITEHALLR